MVALGVALVVAAAVLGVALFLAALAIANQPCFSSPAYKELRRQFREQSDRVEAELARSRRN